MGGAHCASDVLSGNCDYWEEYGNMDCRVHSKMIDQIAKTTGGAVGAGSRCWTSSLPSVIGYESLSSSCYISACASNATVINVTVGTTSY